MRQPHRRRPPPPQKERLEKTRFPPLKERFNETLVPLLFKERLGEVLPDHTKLQFST